MAPTASRSPQRGPAFCAACYLDRHAECSPTMLGPCACTCHPVLTPAQRRALWMLRRAEIEWGPFRVLDNVRAYSVKTGATFGPRQDVMRRLIAAGAVEPHPDHEKRTCIYRVAGWAREQAEGGAQ